MGENERSDEADVSASIRDLKERTQNLVKQRNVNQLLALHLGCGNEKRVSNEQIFWVNSDMNQFCSSAADIYHDASDLRHWDDESVDLIESYHLIEHFGHRKFIQALQEWRRVLKPGGRIIFETPNLAAAIEQFAAKRYNSGEIAGDFGPHSSYETIYGGQENPGHFHSACYTMYQLMIILKAVGFKDHQIIREIPVKGKEYGPDWNIRIVVTK